MELTFALAPAPGFDHEVGRLFAIRPVFRQLTEHGCIFREGGITDIEFKEERFFLARLRIPGGQGMPPPVIAEAAERTVKHTGVTGEIMVIEHGQHLS